MTDAPDAPQIYLISPPVIEPSRFPDLLGACLDAAPVSCFRLALSSTDEAVVGKSADLCREACHARDVAIVIDTHLGIAERHGLDGVHASDHARSVAKLRKALGDDAIVGAHCGASRHDGMTAGELGADYVCFGPVEAGGLGDGSVAEADLFQWWSEMIEVPVIAEGGLSAAAVTRLAPVVDFFAFGPEVWDAGIPAAALKAFAAQLG